MRIRTIKPSFFKDDGLADLQPIVRLLFVGLWCMADSYGRLRDRPRVIRVEVLPFDDCNCDDLLAELHNAGYIIRYVAAGVRCIVIPGFREHQRITGKAAYASSKYPDPPLPETPGKQQGNSGETVSVHPGSRCEGAETETETETETEADGETVFELATEEAFLADYTELLSCRRWTPCNRLNRIQRSKFLAATSGLHSAVQDRSRGDLRRACDRLASKCTWLHDGTHGVEWIFGECGNTISRILAGEFDDRAKTGGQGGISAAECAELAEDAAA